MCEQYNPLEIFLFHFQNPVVFSYYSDCRCNSPIISFPKSLVNVGNAFDGSTFKCPQAGYYSFEFAGTYDSEYAWIEVLKNDAKELSFYDDTAEKGNVNNDESLMSFSFMLKLYKGDSVKLKISGGKFYTDRQSRHRVFSGQFVRPL